jgi:hypothetical protein
VTQLPVVTEAAVIDGPDDLLRVRLTLDTTKVFHTDSSTIVIIAYDERKRAEQS